MAKNYMLNGYQIYIDNGKGEKAFYIPQNQEYGLYDVVYKPKFGSAGSLEFKMSYEHPLKDEIIPLVTTFFLYRDGVKIFRGRYVDSKEDFTLNQTVSIEGGLNFLVDSIQDLTLETVSSTGTGTGSTMTGGNGLTGIPAQVFEKIIKVHNSKVNANRQFKVGVVDVKQYKTDITTQNCQMNVQIKDLKSTSQVLQEEFLNVFGGYISERIVKTKSGEYEYYLDYLSKYGYDSDTMRNNQVIRFRENILDLSKKVDASSIITYLFPVGAKIDVRSLEWFESVTDEYGNQEEYPTQYAKYERVSYDWYRDDYQTHVFEAQKLIKPERDFLPASPTWREGYKSKYELTELPDPNDVAVWMILDGCFNVMGTYEELDATHQAAVTKAQEEGKIHEFNERRTYNVGDVIKTNHYHLVKQDDGSSKYQQDDIYMQCKEKVDPSIHYQNRFLDDPNLWKDLGRQDDLNDGVGSKLTLINEKDETKGDIEKKGMYISSKSGVNKWGKIWGKKEWSDITSTAELRRAAEEFLAEQMVLPETIEFTAYDLSLIDEKVDTFKIGVLTAVMDKPHDLVQYTDDRKQNYVAKWYLTSAAEINISNPANSKITLGAVEDKASEKMSKTEIKATSGLTELEIATNAMIREAVEIATNKICGGLGGYVVLKTGASSGYPEEILVMDSPDYTTAKNVIRINKAGIGFSDNGYMGPFESAWTLKDHAFNANYITAGEITGITIQNAQRIYRMMMDKSSSLKGVHVHDTKDYIYNEKTDLVNMINMMQVTSGGEDLSIHASNHLNIRAPEIVVTNTKPSHPNDDIYGRVTYTGEESWQVYGKLMQGGFVRTINEVNDVNPEPEEHYYLWSNGKDDLTPAGTLYCTLPVYLMYKQSGEYINGFRVSKYKELTRVL